MALITGSTNLQIISDIGINYLFDDYVINDYVIQGTQAQDLDLATVLPIASGTVSASGVISAVGQSNVQISSSITVTGNNIGETTLSITSSLTATAVETAETGSATLVITGATIVAGRLVTVDPFNTYKVLEETRVNTVTRETRTLVIPEETRSFKIKRPVLAGTTTRRNS